MLAPEGEQEGAEPFIPGEGQGSGEEPGEAAVKNPPAYGERDAVKADDGTGEISSGQQSTTAVTTGISG
jgi:hypothetical protein